MAENENPIPGIAFSNRVPRVPSRPELLDRILAGIRGGTAISDGDLSVVERVLTQELQAHYERMETLRKRNGYLEGKIVLDPPKRKSK